MVTRRDFVRAVATAAACAPLAACDVRAFAYRHGAKRRLSIAAGSTGGVYYVYGGAIARMVSVHVPRAEMTAEVTGGSVDNLNFIARGVADLGFALADTLADAGRRQGAFRLAPTTPARALATLYRQPLQLVTFADSGIARLADLRGRRVSLGPPGGGSEIMTLRVLRAAGLDPDRDIQRERLAFAASAEALKDGKLDACFIGAAVPSPAILDVASTQGRAMRLVPLDEALPALQRTYGADVYLPFAIRAGAYPGLAADVAAVGTSNVLVADERLDEALAHDITRALFEYQAELAAVHRVANELTLAAAVTGSPVPYHAGAVRYYRERGAWHA